MKVSSANARSESFERLADLTSGLPIGTAMTIGSVNNGSSFNPAPSAGALR